MGDSGGQVGRGQKAGAWLLVLRPGRNEPGWREEGGRRRPGGGVALLLAGSPEISFSVLSSVFCLPSLFLLGVMEVEVGSFPLKLKCQVCRRKS